MLPAGTYTHEGTKILTPIQSETAVLQTQNCHSVVSAKDRVMDSTEASVQAQSRYDCSILSIRPYKLTVAITGARHRNSTAGAMPEPRKNQKFGFLR